ncbi:MAG: hypothetical protein V7K41_10580 [Nostoc sp.]
MKLWTPNQHLDRQKNLGDFRRSRWLEKRRKLDALQLHHLWLHSPNS